MPAPRDRAALIKAARMYFLDGRRRTRSLGRWGRAGQTSRGCCRRPGRRASSRSACTTRRPGRRSWRRAARSSSNWRTSGSRPSAPGWMRRPRRATSRPSGSTSRCATARCWGFVGHDAAGHGGRFSVDQPRNVELVPLWAACRRSVARRPARSWCVSWRQGWARHSATCTRPDCCGPDRPRLPAGRAGDRGSPRARADRRHRHGRDRGRRDRIEQGDHRRSGADAAEREAVPRRRARRRRLLPVLRRAGPGDHRGGARPRAGDRARPVPPDPDGHRRGHGSEKLQGVLGAIRSELIDGLIVDAGLALALLSGHERSDPLDRRDGLLRRQLLPARVLVHPDQRLPLREDLAWLAHQPARQVVEHERQGMVPGLARACGRVCGPAGARSRGRSWRPACPTAAGTSHRRPCRWPTRRRCRGTSRCAAVPSGTARTGGRPDSAARDRA